VLLEVTEHRIDPGDLYLMCSDGLTDMLDDDAIGVVLAQDIPLMEKALALVERANAQGGRDNISVVLVQAGGGTAARRSLISRWLGK